MWSNRKPKGEDKETVQFSHEVIFAKRSSLGRGKELEVGLLWKGKCEYVTNAGSWVKLLRRSAYTEKA